MVNVIINGAVGRMGKIIMTNIAKHSGISVIGALESASCDKLGIDVGVVSGQREIGVKIVSNPEVINLVGNTVLVDFSSPDSTIERLDFCCSKHIPMVVGTTGFSESQIEKIEKASEIIPILFTTNMSYGANLILKLLPDVAKSLGDDYDVEIVETHHKFKKDSPSGTAKSIAEIICKALNRDTNSDIIYGRKGITGERDSKIVGIHSVRGGDVVGEHTISFFGTGERIEIVHKVSSRDTFALGALKAAKWIVNKTPGFYNMIDVLS